MSDARTSSGSSSGGVKTATRLPTSRRVSPWRRLSLSNPFVSGVLLLLFLGSLLGLLTSDFRYPEAGLSEDDVGTIATQSYRAARDFTFSRIDEEATRSAREQKASEVPPFYRWEVDVASIARRRIREAFAYMRDGIEEVRLDTQVGPGSLVPPPGVPPPPLDTGIDAFDAAALLGAASGLVTGIAGEAMAPATPLAPGQPPPVPEVPDASEILDAAINNWAYEHQDHFEDRLGIAVETGAYKLLVDHRFSERLERDLLELVDAVLQRQVVRDSNQLQSRIATLPRDLRGLGVDPQGAQKPLLMVYRREDGEDAAAVPEYTVSAILDVAEARRVVAEEATDRLSDRSVRERSRLIGLARQFIEPNLVFDRTMTETAREAARESVRDLVVQQEFKQGQIIVDEGHQVTAEHLELWRQMTGEERTTNKVFWGAIGLGIFLVLLLLSVGYLVRSDLWHNRYKRRDIVFLCVSLVMMTLVVRVGEAVGLTVAEAWQWQMADLVVLMVPFAAGPMMLRLVQGGEVAVVFGVLVAVITGLVVELPSVIVPYVLITSIVGAVTLRRTKTRMMALSAGVLVGMVSAACALGLVMFELRTTDLTDLLMVASLALASGILSAVVVTVTLPIVETLFGYTTDIKLLELANLEHPALKDLILKAPGTYHHSMMVGSLNEAAAEAIGANALLTRVGAYYHDIGKMKNAQYFAENQQGDNPHSKLKPNMSALILKAHVKDGIEMARQYKLPQDIIDFIATHHGTSRIEYCYHKAKELESPDIPEVREEDYRYPGPKPQSRETGICMISDTVEAAARALPEKTPARLKMLVTKLINHKFADGQFDECDLTLRDLNMIAEAMLRILTAVYHHRPKYPEQKKSKGTSGGGDGARTESTPAEGTRRESTPAAPAAAVARPRTGNSAAIERAVEAARNAIGGERGGRNGETRRAADAGAPEQSLASMVMERAGVPDSLILGPDPEAPVGRVRTDRSGSGDHAKIETLRLAALADGAEVPDDDGDDDTVEQTQAPGRGRGGGSGAGKDTATGKDGGPDAAPSPAAPDAEDSERG